MSNAPENSLPLFLAISTIHSDLFSKSNTGRSGRIFG